MIYQKSRALEELRKYDVSTGYRLKQEGGIDYTKPVGYFRPRGFYSNLLVVDRPPYMAEGDFLNLMQSIGVMASSSPPKPRESKKVKK